MFRKITAVISLLVLAALPVLFLPATDPRNMALPDARSRAAFCC
jgi:hypothetical protein